MSNENEEVQKESKPSKNQGITLNTVELQALVAAAVKAATESTRGDTEKLVEAIIESRKPYIDPAQEANDRLMRQMMKTQHEQQKKNQELEQQFCQHKQGSNRLSEWSGEGSSFAMHQLDSGEVVGCCTNCGKIISSLKPEDRQFFAMKPGNKMSRAGQRSFVNPIEVQKARTESIKQVGPNAWVGRNAAEKEEPAIDPTALEPVQQ